MNISEKSIIGELVSQNYKAASVFKSYGVDFCCNGNRTIGEACKAKGISSENMLNQLSSVLKEKDSALPAFDAWPMDLLVDYIEKKHHRYVDAKITEIKPFLHKVVKVHGGEHPELVEIEKLFLESAGDLTAHMKKEELILFPFIKKMVVAKIAGDQPNQPHFGTVENPVAMMKEEHNQEGERFRKIAELSNNYTVPADACNTYMVTFGMLKEFEEDLHMHIHLENNILFPQAIALEKELRYGEAFAN
ncbi:iron-sulfur cluster repair di-iron protein [Fontibacter flavus]|uniref:Iron-sulfur cluster repair di-iron protein n=1 Tax=Fontibacter flavus TaxID=654838 RepID=A0ABV6FTN9_9BACT